MTTADLPSAQPRATARSAMIYSSLSFGAVSVLAYSIWAYRLIPGEAALYTCTAAVYIGLAGLALSRIVKTPEHRKRFPLLFAVGFLIYAVAWCAFWFSLHGKFNADLWGSTAGLAGMAWFFRRRFDSVSALLPLFAVLFTFHSLGYYLGENLYASVRGTGGRLLWGAAHGLGFGAGLGYVLFHCQSRATSAPLPHASQ